MAPSIKTSRTATPSTPGIHPDFNGSYQADIDLSQMDVPATYQRDVRPKFVDGIVKNWDAALFRPPTLNPQPGGRFDIVDGQNTQTAALKRGHVTMPCIVLGRSLSDAEAAGLFLSINNERKRTTEFDSYKAGLVAGEKGAVITHKVVVVKHGFTAGAKAPSDHPDGVRCVGACMNEARRPGGEKVIDLAFEALTRAFDGTVPANRVRFQRAMVGGMFDVIRRMEKAGLTFDPVAFGKVVRKSRIKLGNGIVPFPVTASNIQTDFVTGLGLRGVSVSAPSMRRGDGDPRVGFLLAIAGFGEAQAKALYR